MKGPTTFQLLAVKARDLVAKKKDPILVDRAECTCGWEVNGDHAYRLATSHALLHNNRDHVIAWAGTAPWHKWGY